MQKVLKIQFTRPIQRDSLSEYVLCRCSFCEKRVEVKTNSYDACIRLGHGHFYCPFCLRHHQTFKSQKHVLLLDFKGIIGYGYHHLYADREIWLSEIIEQIGKHAQIGLNNPVFNYDPESFLWFVDFNRVGDTKHKVPLNQVKNTVSDIVDVFTIAGSVHVLKNRYHEAIDVWYKERKRPEKKRVLSPTLSGVVFHNVTDWEATKQISPDLFGNQIHPTPCTQQSFCEDLTEPALDKLSVEVKRKRNKDEWQGTVTIPGLSPCRLVQKDNNPSYPSRQSLGVAARSLSNRLGVPIEYIKSETRKTPAPTPVEPPLT